MTVSMHSDTSPHQQHHLHQPQPTINGYHWPAKTAAASVAVANSTVFANNGRIPTGASSPLTETAKRQSALYTVCNALKDKIDAFLAEDPETPLLRDVQDRLRVSMDITEQAYRKYRYFTIFCSGNSVRAPLLTLPGFVLQARPDCDIMERRKRL